MILFLDSSSLMKLYVDEEGSDAVRGWVAASEAVAIARIGRLELASGLARRHRDGHLSAERLQEARRAFEADWPSYLVVEMDLGAAERLVDRQRLRSLDALQLAALQWVAAKVPSQDLRFACHDAQLAAAARAEGVSVQP